MKAIVIDDEQKAVFAVESIVKEYCTELEWAGSAQDLPSGVRLIKKIKPDIVFLDIEMPGYSGLNLLEFFNEDEIDFEIIFTTAYSEFAIQAFQLSAMDYLLKPIQIDQLVKAVEKIQRKKNREINSEKISALKRNLQPETQVLKIAIPVTDGLLFVQSSEISYLKAEGSYTQFFMVDGTKHLVSKILKEYERLLSLKTFFRPHRSFIINLDEVKHYIRKDGGYLVMKNGDHISISQEKKDDLLKLLQV